MQSALILPFFLFLSVIVISIFSFAAVSSWSNARRGEREAFYRSETIRRLMELHTTDIMGVMEFVREENKEWGYRRRDRSRLAGLVTGSVGFGLMIFLYAMLRAETAQPVYLVGLIPVFIGGALLSHSFFIKMK
jgi:multisubunit Na+/H+ antiporter MnhB subunit